MARAYRATAADIKALLIAEAQSFAFFQAIRLLRLYAREQDDTGEGYRDIWENIRVRPNLSLAFPENDIAQVDVLDEGKLRLTANFMGLYGVSSPLPTFYTEDLIDESQHDKTATRDFIDVVHYALYPLFFEAWAKYRQFLKVTEENDSSYGERLYSLVGLGDAAFRDGLPDTYGLIRYAGLFSQFPRSALGLQTILSDALQGVPVTVFSCVQRRVRISADQQLSLGGGLGLGLDTFLGQEIDDRMGSVEIRIGPLTRDQFQQLLPKQPMHDHLRFLTRMYLIDPLQSSVELTLQPEEMETAVLGGPHWSSLGLDTWVYSGELGHDAGRANFVLYK